ncbi:MAG TPA: adenylate/guanylate cyclase domain-containing protein [Chitinophagales bacterium]|nr:adenylate/guanylate cyclase domain-containing protein [Chitinophagales bacterium]
MRFLLLICTTLCVGFVNAQKHGQALIDSLSVELRRSGQDTNAVNVLTALAYNTLERDPAMSLRFADQAKALSERLGWKKGSAVAERMRGNAHATLGDNGEAVQCFHRALTLSKEIGDLHGIASNDGNIGSVYHNQGKFPIALEHFMRSLATFEKLGNKFHQALQHSNIGLVHEAQGSCGEALQHYERALELYRELNNEPRVAEVLVSIGNVYSIQGRYDKSLEVGKDALAQSETLGNAHVVAQAHRGIGLSYYMQRRFPEAVHHWYKALPVLVEASSKREIGGTLANIAASYLYMYDTQTDSLPDSLRNKTRLLDKAVALLSEAEKLNAEVGDMYTSLVIYESLYNAYRLQTDYPNALKYHVLFTAMNDSIFSAENQQRIEALSRQRERDVNEREIKLRDVQVKNYERENRFYSIGLIALVAFSALVVFLYRRANRERDRSENLLLNILPSHTANELKENGHSEAKLHPDVTVMFTDFVDFSKMTERMPPKEMVALIDHYYKGFDKIVRRHKLEKIKTIGDAYMAACGVPVSSEKHAEATINASLEIVEFVNKEAIRREATGLPFFHVRIGVNSGPVVAGIVGESKFAYDIWGDTVNLAARMEQSGVPGKVNISGTTFALIKGEFECQRRGKIKVKHGQEVEMYFVESEVHEAVHA